MSTQQFIHLHLHTEYSIADGLSRIPELVARTRSLGMPAVAVTDRSNTFALLKFFSAARSAGIKPVLGCEVFVAPDAGDAAYPLVLLCANYAGYQSLASMLSRAYLEDNRRGTPRINAAWMTREALSGLIALSGGMAGDIGQAISDGKDDVARRRLAAWQSLMDDRFYVEISRTGRADEKRYLDAAVALADELAAPLVATNDVRFIDSSDFEAHEARVCVQEGALLSDPRRPRRYSNQQYLRSPAEMWSLFADLPDALENTVGIAQRCNVSFDLDTYHMPRFPDVTPEAVDDLLASEAASGLTQRLAAATAPVAPAEPDAEARQLPPREEYDRRLAHELGVITKMGFAGYFLIVADFVRWAKEQGIPVGPGRGSGAGSLVAYALGITELDPLEYDLLFERFLNPERVSMPDFDIDFCMERRDEVIDYVVDRYGRERVAQIITHGTMAAKAVVRDVGRVLGFGYGFVDEIAKQIPFEIGMTLTRALQESPELKARYDADEEVQSIIDLALKLEGLARNAGRHAGGVVISPQPLRDYMPLYCEQGTDAPVTQFDMGDVEAVGLVKFDFLGLRTLTIIDWALADINAERAHRQEAALDILDLPLDDKASFELVRAASTTAVFQLESRGMKELIKRLQPDLFDDLVALVALFRPGPLQSGMVDDYIDRKHGRAPVRYPHPELEPILKPTYGVILYQEQVMQIAQTLAGFTLGAADLLRRAMGKKKAAEMAKQREIFVSGASERGVDADVAAGIFDLMEKFAGYGFNKSHSAAYALVAYQTAWLKAHYPAAFMAAVMSADMDSTDKIISLVDECRRMQLTVQQPDVNASDYRFSVSSPDAILYGLGAIKGCGRGAIAAMTAARAEGGPFASLDDFCTRVGSARLSRRIVEALIKAGAMDSISPSRATLMEGVGRALQKAEQGDRAPEAGQADLFGLEATPAPAADDSTAPPVPEWSADERLAREKETLGLYLTGHPMDQVAAEARSLVTCKLNEIGPGPRRIAGIISGTRIARSRRGRMALVTLDDGSARIEVAVYSEILDSVSDKLIPDAIVVVDGQCAVDDFSGGYSVSAQAVHTLAEARRALSRRLALSLSCGNGALGELKAALEPYQGGRCPVTVEFETDGAVAELALGGDWAVNVTGELLQRLQGVLGPEAVKVEYHRFSPGSGHDSTTPW